MCYIVFITHSLHWRYIKTALQEYVIMLFRSIAGTGDLLSKHSYALINRARGPYEEIFVLTFKAYGPNRMDRNLS